MPDGSLTLVLGGARSGKSAHAEGLASAGPGPWHYLATGRTLAPPSLAEMYAVLRAHLLDHYAFYGAQVGVRTARKHVGWYAEQWPGGEALRDAINRADDPDTQLRLLDAWFDAQPPRAHHDGRLAA